MAGIATEPGGEPSTASCGSRTSRSVAPVRSRKASRPAASDRTLDLGDGGSLDGRDVVDRRRIAAERAGRVAGQSDLAHPGVERIDEQQPPHERLAGSEQQLERLGSLPGADDAGQRPEHAALGARRNLALGRRLGEDAAVARAAGSPEDRHLPVEAKDRPVDVRPSFEHAGVVDEIAGLERVRAVDDQVVEAHEFARVGGHEAHRNRVDCDVGIERPQPFGGGLDLQPPDAGRVVQDLALKIRHVDAVVVDDPDPADARGRQVRQHRRAQAARTDAEHARRGELALPLQPDFGDQQMAAVTAQLGASRGDGHTGSFDSAARG